jgi:hypothetical protein
LNTGDRLQLLNNFSSGVELFYGYLSINTCCKKCAWGTCCMGNIAPHSVDKCLGEVHIIQLAFVAISYQILGFYKSANSDCGNNQLHKK